jgi:hypothetical protein
LAIWYDPPSARTMVMAAERLSACFVTPAAVVTM